MASILYQRSVLPVTLTVFNLMWDCRFCCSSLLMRNWTRRRVPLLGCGTTIIAAELTDRVHIEIARGASSGSLNSQKHAGLDRLSLVLNTQSVVAMGRGHRNDDIELVKSRRDESGENNLGGCPVDLDECH
jgi:hypothetical protein